MSKCFFIAVLLVLTSSMSSASRQPESPDHGLPSLEVRGLWVQRASLGTPASVAAVVDSAQRAGFNTLIVQVRGRGDAFYQGRHEPRAALLASQPASFDPLAMILERAHRAGLRVHAWVNVNLVSDAALPASRRHVVHSRPEWLMVPRPLATDLARVNPRSPAYVGRLVEYARAHKDRVEGLYMSPLNDAAADHTMRVVADIVSRYDVDGVHLDYARFPNEEFDFSAAALDAFRKHIRAQIPSDERREYDRRSRGRPLFYTEMFPQRWQEFRRDRLTALVTKLRALVKSRRPQAMFTAAVFPDPADAANRRFQDWAKWLDAGLLDAICPMAYTADAARFEAQVEAVETIAGGRPVWAGIGAYQLQPHAAVSHIQTARRLGTEGVVLFSYDNLDSSYLADVSDGAFVR